MDIFKQLITECQQDDQCVDLRRSMLKEIPTEIYSKNSENIQFLYLEENEIAVLPDDFFPTLRHLKWLDMRNNLLQCIPSTIANHENLETLLLKNNKIETLPLELGTLARLRGLQLQGNPLRFPAEAVVRAGAEAVLRCLREEAAARAARGPVLALPPPPAPSPPPPHSPPPPSPPRRARTAAAGAGAGAAGESGAGGARPKPRAGPSAPPRARRVALLPAPPPQDEDSAAAKENSKNPSKNKGGAVAAASALETTPAHPRKASEALFTRRRRTKIIERILRDLWMEKVKQSLMKQERIIERKKSEVALKAWRRKFMIPDMSFVRNYKFKAPYDLHTDGPSITRRVEREDLEALTATLEDNMAALEGSPEEQHKALARRVDVLTELQKRLHALRLKSTQENAYFLESKRLASHHDRNSLVSK